MQKCTHILHYEQLTPAEQPQWHAEFGPVTLLTVPYLGEVKVCQECREELQERFTQKVITNEPPATMKMG